MAILLIYYEGRKRVPSILLKEVNSMGIGLIFILFGGAVFYGATRLVGRETRRPNAWMALAGAIILTVGVRIFTERLIGGPWTDTLTALTLFVCFAAIASWGGPFLKIVGILVFVGAFIWFVLSLSAFAPDTGVGNAWLEFKSNARDVWDGIVGSYKSVN